MLTKVNSKIFQKNNLNKLFNVIPKKNFAMAKFDYTDPLQMEELLTEEEKMVKIFF